MPSRHTHRSEIVDGERLRQLRNERRMSNTALAAEAGVSTSTLERALAGKRPVGLASIDRLANYFGLRRPQELVKKSVAEAATPISDTSQWPVSLHRVESGAKFISFIRKLRSIKQLELTVTSISHELNDDTGELVATLVEYAEAFVEKNRSDVFANEILRENQAAMIRRAAQFNKIVKLLGEQNIVAFIGDYMYQGVALYQYMLPPDSSGEVKGSGNLFWQPTSGKRAVLHFVKAKNEQDTLSVTVDRGLTDNEIPILVANCPNDEPDPVGWFRREVAKDIPAWATEPKKGGLVLPYPDDDFEEENIEEDEEFVRQVQVEEDNLRKMQGVKNDGD